LVTEGGSISRSTDGGRAWEKVANITFTDDHGPAPGTRIRQIAPSGEAIYALAEGLGGNAQRLGLALYRSGN